MRHLKFVSGKIRIQRGVTLKEMRLFEIRLNFLIIWLKYCMDLILTFVLSTPTFFPSLHR